MAGRNISVSEASRPVLPRHAKLKFDETRQVWVILAPERVLAPDEIAVEVLQLCDGVRSVAQMIDQLAEKYAAERGAIATEPQTHAPQGLRRLLSGEPGALTLIAPGEAIELPITFEFSPLA